MAGSVSRWGGRTEVAGRLGSPRQGRDGGGVEWESECMRTRRVSGAWARRDSESGCQVGRWAVRASVISEAKSSVQLLSAQHAR